MAGKLQITIGIGSDTGIQRASKGNEDLIGTYADYPEGRLHVVDKGFLFVLADGMGGAAGGAEASGMAVETVLHSYYEDDDPDIVHSVIHSIREANTQVYYRGHHDAAVEGMGTTIVTAVIFGNQLFIANIGDSRAYLLRHGLLEQLSTDHTVVQMLFDEGIISREQTLHHPLRHVLQQNLGGKPEVEPAIHTAVLQPGDVILLCSDGLWDAVDSEEEIIDVLQKHYGNKASRSLIRLANQHGGPDNVSVVVVHIDHAASHNQQE